MKRVVFSILFLLCTNAFMLNGQQSWIVELSKSRRLSDAETIPVQDGVIFLGKRAQGYEVILLNEQFMPIRKTRIPSIEQRRSFFGLRETTNHYILYLNRGNVGPFLEVFYIDKQSFEFKVKQFYQTIADYHYIKDFILNNEFFSISVSLKHNRLRLVRSFGDEAQVFLYPMKNIDLRLIGNARVKGMNMRRHPQQFRNMAIEKDWEYSMYDAHVRNKFYLNEGGELLLTIDRYGDNLADLKVFKFKADLRKPEEAKLEEHLIRRPMANQPDYDANSFYFNEHLFSVTLSNQEIMLDVYKADDFTKVASHSSRAEGNLSIKPERIRQAGRVSLQGDGYKKSEVEKTMDKMAKGMPAVTVEDRDDHLVATLGSYFERAEGGTLVVESTDAIGPGILPVGVPGDTYFTDRLEIGTGVSYYYEVKLDKQNFESLGLAKPTRRIHAQAGALHDTCVDLNTFRNSRTFFEREGVLYLGYQLKESKTYMIQKLEPAR